MPERGFRTEVARRAALALVVCAGAAILAATLWPHTSEPGAPRRVPAGGLALYLGDVLRNVLLFVPLGAGLATFRVSAGPALAAGLLLSAAVETAQLLIPGRSGALVDVATNALGTALGYAAVRTIPGWIDPPRARARRLVGLAALVAGGIFLSTGWLFQPVGTDEMHRGGFTPAFWYRTFYPGHAVAASVGGVSLPPAGWKDFAAYRELFAGDFSLELALVAADAPPAQAPLFLSTRRGGLHVFELALDGHDVVFEFLTRGHLVGLEMARLLWLDAFAEVRPGQRVSVGIERRGADHCLTVDEGRSCGEGFHAADGWQLFALPVRALVPWHAALSFLWVAGLCVPLGYWGRLDAFSGAAWTLVLAALVGAPAVFALLPTPIHALAGAAAGGVVGALIRSGVSRLSAG